MNMTDTVEKLKMDAAAKALEATAEEHGGPYAEPEPYRGSCARTMFDRPGSEDGTVTVLVPEDNVHALRRDAFVRIDSVHPRTGEVDASFVGTVSSGPFAEPDALAATAPTLLVAAANGAVLTPKYHGIAEIALIGEVSGAVTIPATRRPCPNSPVFKLGDDQIVRTLGLDIAPSARPFRLGLLQGHDAIEVMVPAADKGVLFKHAAILGTTGGGKSTTVSGLVTRLAGEGNAVVLFDVEGEYATMHKPADNDRMLAALAKRGLAAAGTPSTRLFHLDGRSPADPSHPDLRPFKIPFDAISPYVMAELLELSEPQERRFLEAYEICRITMEKEGIFPATPKDHQTALDIDELSRGWPKMTLPMVLDVVSAAIAYADGAMDELRARSGDFKGKEGTLKQIVNARKPEKDVRSWKAIAKKLWRMQKADVFAPSGQTGLDVSLLVQPGTVSIFDLSDMEAPYLRNLVITQVLRSLQEHQVQCCAEQEEAQRNGKSSKPVQPVNIFIEEAHEFVSRERIKQMPYLFAQITTIARRGRKHYIGLVFVTQSPGHLPDEVLGLVNNWILHKLTDESTTTRLRKIVPGVTAATWGAMPNLAPGQALCSFVHLARPVMTSVDPSPCRLRMVN